MWIEIFLFLLLVFMLIYMYVTKHFGYFKKHGVPEIPGYFPWGSANVKKGFTGEIDALKVWDEPSKGIFKDERFYGAYSFGQRNLLVKDVELCKLILIKDADHFIDRMTFGVKYEDAHEEVDKLFGMFLTNMTGDAWKRMRTLTSPVFTSGKLKLMVPHINKCSSNMRDLLEEYSKTGETIIGKELFGKFALDSIATSGFGIESNSFKDPENLFRINAMKLTRDSKYASVFDIPKFMVAFIAPKLASKLGISAFSKPVSRFFVGIVRNTMKARRESGARRNDIIDIFIDELDKSNDNSFFSNEELELGFVATAILFFFAGFDTTSTTLSVVMHALMHHPDVQDKVREEIEEVIGDEELNAEHLKELKYMENVIHESMRKYFGLAIQRTCTKDYKIPDSDFVIPKGLMVNLMPEMDKCFANPDNFDPSNFEEENQFNKIGFVSFGQGPRNCIGMRYAMQALKIAIIGAVRSFKIVPSPESAAENGLKFNISKNGFWPLIKFKVEAL